MSLRIAVVTTSYPTPDDDVSGHFVRSEVKDLVAAGHQVTVFCPGAPGEHPEPSGAVVRALGAERAFGWPGVLAKLRRDPLASFTLPGFVWRCQRQLRRGRFDRVIAHWLLGSGFPIALAARAPVEVVVHGSDARLLSRLGPLRSLILGALQARDVQLRFVAPHLAPLLRTATNGAWLDRARIMPLPVTLPPLPSRAELRAELGVGGEFLAVCVGRLIPSKRVADALSHAPFPAGARVVVIGSGPLLEPLRRRFPNVHFTGQLGRDQALRWLKAADVAVSASRDEGAPTALREARLLETPIWTAEFGSAAEWARQDPGVRVLDELS